MVNLQLYTRPYDVANSRSLSTASSHRVPPHLPVVAFWGRVFLGEFVAKLPRNAKLTGPTGTIFLLLGRARSEMVGEHARARARAALPSPP